MAITLRGAIDRLGRAVLEMPLERFADQRTDAADGDGPAIPGAAQAIDHAAHVVAGISGNVADKVERNSRSEFKRLGISLRESEPKFGKLIDGWRSENVDRAKSLVGFERDQLSAILAKGENKTVSELRGRILERLDVSRAKANLLARDQVLKLNAKITQERQTAAGITEYIWTTSNDERVRETHDELDGETFSWDDPPVTNEAGDRNHPGEDYQCRCVAFPVLPELGEGGGGDDEPDEPAPEPEPPEPEQDKTPAVEPPDPPAVARVDALIAGLKDPKNNGGDVRDILREQIASSLPGVVSKDIAGARALRSSLVVDDSFLQMAGANAIHDWDGNVIVRDVVLKEAAKALELRKHGFPATYEQRDRLRTLVHEELHGHSRVTQRSYSGVGATLEEVGTELNARRITGEILDVDVKVGSYQKSIEQVRDAVRGGLDAARGNLTPADIDKMIADGHAKGVLTAGPGFVTPLEAAFAFADGLDVTPTERAAILQRLKRL